MNSLEHFDEQYNSFQESISQVTALVIQCKDVLSSTVDTQKKIRNLYNEKLLSPSDISPFLDSISQILSISSELLSTVENIKSSILLSPKKD